MRKPILVALLVTAWLLTVWSFVSWAQPIDATPCQQACYEQKTACIGTCDAGNNPTECEAQCDDRLTDCLRHCR
jgi:hypothetical protein